MDLVKREVRHGGELREVAERDGDFIMEALAHRTGVVAEIFDMTEEFKPGAFKGAIGKSDIVFNVDHGMSSGVLARTASGTLKVWENDDGLMLRARMDLADPETQSLKSKVGRGDLSEFSFAFRISRDGQEWDEDHRLVTDVRELFDVSIVERPAFDGTGVVSQRDKDSAALARSLNTYDHAEADVKRTMLAEARHEVYAGITRRDALVSRETVR